MRKIILGLLLLISITGFSQIQFALKGGANVSNLSGMDANNFTTHARIGFHAGGFIAIKLGRLALQPEFLYSTQGMQFDSMAGKSYSLNLNYFTLPVMLKYRTKGGFYLETGPVLGYESNSDFSNRNVSENISNADFSWAAGMGYHGKSGLGIGTRYHVGLSKVVNNDFASAFQKPDYKNAVLQVSIFYSFFGNGKNKAKNKTDKTPPKPEDKNVEGNK